MIIDLEANGQTDLDLRGRTIVYLAGAAQLLFVTAVGRFQIPAGGQVTLPAVFEKVTVINMTGAPTSSEVLFIEGEYQRLSDVSLVQIQGITNAITANIASLPAVQVSQLPAVEVESLPDVQVSQLPAVEVESLPDASSFLTTTYTVDEGGSATVPARVGRKNMIIQAYSNSEDVTYCRVSDADKTSAQGIIMACGGGLLAEITQNHAAAFKFWNPSTTEKIELIVSEEF